MSSKEQERPSEQKQGGDAPQTEAQRKDEQELRQSEEQDRKDAETNVHQ